MHVRGPDQLHGYSERLVGDHMPNHLGGPPADMGVLKRTEIPVRKTLETSGPGQVAYQIHDEEVTAAAVDFLNYQGIEQRGTKDREPFSLTVGFMLPHPPYVPRQADYDVYRNQISLPKKMREFEQERHPFLRLWRQHTGSESVSLEEALNTRAAYWALVTQVDKMIGQILAALDANGLTNNTLIIYTSDHGDMQGEHGLWWKHVFYEESIRVPLMMSWPGIIPSKQRCPSVVSAIDVTATILDALQAPALPHSPGRSVLGLVDGRGISNWDDIAFAEYCEDQYSPEGGCYHRMIRQDEWKLIYYHGYTPQLFNLANDPDELFDLAQEPAYDTVREALLTRLLSDWDPVEIVSTMAARRADNLILERWAEQTSPPDQFRWPVRSEMNWLGSP